MPRGIYTRQSQNTKEVKDEDEDDILIMSLRLKSNKFESTIQIPLNSSEESRKNFIESWLNLMEMGLKCSPNKRVKV